MFSFNEHDGDTIGCLWCPVLTDRPWRKNLPYSSRPHSSPATEKEVGCKASYCTCDVTNESVLQPLLNVNKEAILSEIKRLGHDLVSDIIIQTKDAS